MNIRTVLVLIINLVLVSACNLANPEPPQIQELTGEPTITLTLIPTVN
jgi:hypothetical protein